MGRIPWPIKWLLAPAAAALLGYGVVGPKLAGHQKRLMEAVQAHVGEIAPVARHEEEAPPKASEEPVQATPAPQVSVGVKPLDEDASAPLSDATPPPRHRRHRRRRAAAPSDEAPPEAAPASDRDSPDPASTPG